MKCSGTRPEVSGSWLEGRGGVGKGREIGVERHCYVHKRLQGHSSGLWEHFPAFFFLIFQFFYPILGRSSSNVCMYERDFLIN